MDRTGSQDIVSGSQGHVREQALARQPVTVVSLEATMTMGLIELC
jgi:hypothetical protein